MTVERDEFGFDAPAPLGHPGRLGLEDGHATGPEIGERLYRELRSRYAVEFDPKQSIGKRYARMDEAGTPYCFTIDSDTLTDQTVTVRERDSLSQERIGLDRVASYLAERIDG